MSIIEDGRFDYVRRLLDRDLSTFAGVALEKIFQEIIGYSSDYGQIGNWWDKRSQNEIDIVAVNDIDKKLLLAEVKLNHEKIRISKLKDKSVNLLKKYPDYQVEYMGLSIQDIERLLRNRHLP